MHCKWHGTSFHNTAACLCLLLAVRSTRPVTIRHVGLLALAQWRQLMVHSCSRAQLSDTQQTKNAQGHEKNSLCQHGMIFWHYQHIFPFCLHWLALIFSFSLCKWHFSSFGNTMTCMACLCSPPRMQYQATQNQLCWAATTHPVETDDIAQSWWSTADDWLLKEAVPKLHKWGCALLLIRVNL